MRCWKLFVAFGVLAVGVSLFAMERDDEPSQDKIELSALMRAKLASSQKVVEGLMAKNFELIRQGGDEISKICLAEAWRAEDDQVYAHYRAELRRTGLKLVLQAEEKNLDGAAYTYMHSLTNCISCHDYCRDVLHVAAQNPRLEAVPPPSSDKNHGNVQRSLRR